VKNWFKRYLIKLLFLIAAISLVLSGIVLIQPASDAHVFSSVYIAMLGTWLLYGFDFRDPLKTGWQRLFILQLILAGILGFSYLDHFQIKLLFGVALSSLLYQFNMPFIARRFQLKRYLLVKNLLIGLSWAALVPFGANSFDDSAVQFLFWFVAIQVGYGSIIRDISDIEHDAKHQLQTLPIKFGIKKTLLFLHLINVLSLLLCLLFVGFDPFSWLFQLSFVVVFYKALILLQVQLNHRKLIWTQYLNILTCLLIFILTFWLNS
jgi:4-hydroxybenzoate polyprenyltransferase